MGRGYPTKRETEIKLRVPDIGALTSALRRIGARSQGRVLERNTLYDTPESHFRKSGCLLRLRVETPAPSPLAHGGRRRALFTWKSPVSKKITSRYKQNLEREALIASPARWPRILEALGLRPAFRYEKYRTTYRLGALHVDLDETPIGVFLELEGNPHAIDRLARRLGVGPHDYSEHTYWDLYAADCKRRGRTPRNMLFSA
jgi:adenylate cyclase class 2